jgi:peptide/nickel transport system substrate-binding protein
MAIMVGHMQLTSNELMQGNYQIGPHGTSDVDWLAGFAARYEVMAGELAESWDLPDSETIIYNLKKGVRYHNKPPVNGRELIAEDVVYWMEKQFETPGLWQNIAYTPDRHPISYRAIDKYTVEIKIPAKDQGILLLEIGDNAYTAPPELWTEYGGIGSDWEKYVGTGPFILTEYVADSYAIYTKNTDYFEYDPVLVDYRLPYADIYKELIITDPSTRLASFRTGKVDYINALEHDDAHLLINQLPDVKYVKYINACMAANIVAGRIDAPPFDDIRVRQAMNLAINQQEILDDYYSGDGELGQWPYPAVKIFEPYYTPLNDMPEEVKMLFEYDPEQAKELLTDAGYPDGFKTTCITQNTPAAIDYLSLIQAYLADIGIDMTIDPIESGAFNSVRIGKNQKAGDMMNGVGIMSPDQPLAVKPGTAENYAWVDDPYYDELFEVTSRDIITNPNNFQQYVKEANIHQLASAWGIWKPMPYLYNLWWPWVKEYHGVVMNGWANQYDWNKLVWIDQDLKKTMGY